MRRTARVLALLALAVASAAADAKPHASLIVGDDAPPLHVGTWISGKPVENLDRGTVYVVELWGTWNPQCKAALPALADVAKQFPAVRCVAVGVNEPDDAAARAFVHTLGDKVAGVSIALDDDSPPHLNPQGEPQVDGVGLLVGSIARDWWQASGKASAPTAIVVNADGVIAWAGQPKALATTLAQVVAGTFDLDAARRKSADAAAGREQSAVARAELDAARGQMANPNDPDALVAAVDPLMAKYPAAKLEMLRAKFAFLLMGKHYDEAYRVSDDVSAAAAAEGDAQVLNEIAWTIVSTDQNRIVIDRPDVSRAKRYAEQAVEASDGESGEILDTLARAQFLNGELAAAVGSETKAISLCDENVREQLEKCLADYKSAAATQPTK